MGLKNMLRWILFLPTAVLGGWIVYWIAKIVDSIYIGYGGSSLFFTALIECSAHAVMGYTFAVIGTNVAPNHRLTVVICLAGIVVLVAGASIFASIMIEKYLTILYNFFMIGGAAVYTFEIYQRERE